jgi:glycosyltransferase involved in cell wall biosynthesis
VSPIVSIVLPTFNRAKFLPKAIESIARQSFLDWELIIVDDGSDDETLELLPTITQGMSGRVNVISQINQGPGAARNVGIRAARGDLIAFFDSDDVWEYFHLSRCVEKLERNPELDWVYGNFRRIGMPNGTVIEADEFCRGGVAAPFLKLKVETKGNLAILDDSRTLECMIVHGLGVSLRASVVRRKLFDKVEFPKFRIGEDQALWVRAIASGFRFGYVRDIHATAYEHATNTSNAANQKSREKSISVLKELKAALESLRDIPLTRREMSCLNRRIADLDFWGIGYAYAGTGAFSSALQFMREGIALCPMNAAFWKTYVVTMMKRISIRGGEKLGK